MNHNGLPVIYPGQYSRTIPYLHSAHVVKCEKADSRVTVLKIVFVYLNTYVSTLDTGTQSYVYATISHHPTSSSSQSTKASALPLLILNPSC